ncbi:MAG: class I adenylate-forming enzyme family protein [Acidihalobacter sp.]
MLFALLEKHATETPAKLAIAEGNRTISYGELSLFISMVTANLSAIGVTRGTKIAICLSHSIEYITLFFAITRVGAVVIPFPATVENDETNSVHIESNCDYILIEDAYLEKFKFKNDAGINSVIVSDNTPGTSLYDVFRENASSYEGGARFADANFAMRYASDTNVLSKEPAETQHGYVSRVTSYVRAADLTSNDSTLRVPHHANTADRLSWSALITGQTLYLVSNDNKDPAKVAQIIDTEAITIFDGPSWFYRDLIDTPNIERFKFSSLRIAIYGQGPLPKRVADWFLRRLDLRVVDPSGLTGMA